MPRPGFVPICWPSSSGRSSPWRRSCTGSMAPGRGLQGDLRGGAPAETGVLHGAELVLQRTLAVGGKQQHHQLAGRPKPAYASVQAGCRPVRPSARIPRFQWRAGRGSWRTFGRVNDGPEAQPPGWRQAEPRQAAGGHGSASGRFPPFPAAECQGTQGGNGAVRHAPRISPRILGGLPSFVVELYR